MYLYFPGPGKHIDLLFAKWESAISEKEKLMSQITQIEEQHKIDIELQINLQKDDAENRIADAVEKARLEGTLQSLYSLYVILL